jgi:hypothetical protein
MTMGIILLVLIVVGWMGMSYLKKKDESPPTDSYVCDLCGERECICHKEDEGNQT